MHLTKKEKGKERSQSFTCHSRFGVRWARGQGLCTHQEVPQLWQDQPCKQEMRSLSIYRGPYGLVWWQHVDSPIPQLRSKKEMVMGQQQSRMGGSCATQSRLLCKCRQPRLCFHSKKKALAKKQSQPPLFSSPSLFTLQTNATYLYDQLGLLGAECSAQAAYLQCSKPTG